MKELLTKKETITGIYLNVNAILYRCNIQQSC